MEKIIQICMAVDESDVYVYGLGADGNLYYKDGRQWKLVIEHEKERI